MTIVIDRRALRALELAAGAADWTRLANGAFAIPSQSVGGQVYVATPQLCGCADSARHPGQLCKHSMAAAIVQTLIDTMPPRPELPPLTDAQAARILGRL